MYSTDKMYIERKGRTQIFIKDQETKEFPTGITKDPITERENFSGMMSGILVGIEDQLGIKPEHCVGNAVGAIKGKMFEAGEFFDPTGQLKAKIQTGKYKLKASTINTPTLDEMDFYNKKFGLDIKEHELEKYQDMISKLTINYDRIRTLPEPKLEVKYPRVPTTTKRSMDDDNKHNAWYVKSEIKGKSDGKLKDKKMVICDTIPVAGLSHAKGTMVLTGRTPMIDASVVTKSLDEGVTIKGKSNCEPYGITGNSFTSVKGPVLNAKDPKRSAGGASSGAAVLVAKKEVDIALGVDEAGQVRVPACWNGVVGMKPTYGLVPCTGVTGVDPLMTHVGTMADKVHDVACTMESIAIKDKDTFGYDLDIRQPRNLTPKKFTDQLTGDVKGMKIGIITEAFLGCEKDVDTMVKNAAKMLTKAGATCVEEVSIPGHIEAECIFFPLLVEGLHLTTTNMGDHTLPHTYHETTDKDAFGNAYKSKFHTASPIAKLLKIMGHMMQDKYNMKYYSKAQNLTRLLKKAYDDAFAKYDILICPTTKFKAPMLPTDETMELKDILMMSMNMFTNTVPFNLTGHPALTINCGMSENLPIGMQIIGKEFEDDKVLKTAFAFEKVRGF